jgi:hypothetical protein
MSKTMSPTQRTLRQLRIEGCFCASVERFNPHVGPHGIRQDLFGIIDIIALNPEIGVVGIQACAGSGFNHHYKKLTEENAQATKNWLETPGTKLFIWAWRKVKKNRGGKAMIWQPRIREINLKDII